MDDKKLGELALSFYDQLLKAGCDTPSSLHVLGYVAGVAMASGLQGMPEVEARPAWAAASVRMSELFSVGYEVTKGVYARRKAN